MTREEYLAMLDSEPVTFNQRGAIIRECDRLGLVDRAERLAVLAALIGVDELASTADLTMGQGGQLVNALQRVRDRAELLDLAAADEHQDDEPEADEPVYHGMTWGEAFQRFALMLASAYVQRTAAGEKQLANIGTNVDQLRTREGFNRPPESSA